MGVLAAGPERRGAGVPGSSDSGHRVFWEAGADKRGVGEAETSSPAEGPDGPGLCRVAGAQLPTPETAEGRGWGGRRPVVTCIPSFIHSDDPMFPEAHLCQACPCPRSSRAVERHNQKPLENNLCTCAEYCPGNECV